MNSEDFFNHLQKRCLPGIWSKGVALARGGAVEFVKGDDEERQLTVRASDRPISHKVTLWPSEGDWYCDCGSKAEVCAHVAAAAIYARTQGLENSEKQVTSGGPKKKRISELSLYPSKRKAGSPGIET